VGGDTSDLLFLKNFANVFRKQTVKF